ncbi:hypothetical protein GWI33_002015, partial [Rhynchophorus ferrugineus]
KSPVYVGHSDILGHHVYQFFLVLGEAQAPQKSAVRKKTQLPKRSVVYTSPWAIHSTG